MRTFQRLAAAVVALGLSALGSGNAGAALQHGSDEPTFSGSYLAGRSADQERDINSAITFYRSALAFQPADAVLTERLMLLTLAKGDMLGATALAKKVIALADDDPPARLILAVDAYKAGHVPDALSQLDKIAPSELSTITAGLFRAWIQFGQHDVDGAVKTIAALNGPDWYSVFKDFQTALLLDAAGRSSDAVAPIKRAYAADATVRGIVVAYARIMARAGQRDEAIRSLTALGGGDNPHTPLVRYLLQELKDGGTLPPQIASADAGVAETFLDLGLIIGTDDGPELPASYLRLANYLDVGQYLATIAIGDVFESVGKCDEALKLYQAVPASAIMWRDAALEAGACLARQGGAQEGAKLVQRVVDADPTDIDAATQLGDIYRAQKDMHNAVVAYSRSIDAVHDPATAGWGIYFDRAIAYTALNQWPAAESDLKQSLALNPDQPEVLNYLGYSWVDRNENLEQALDMIKKAVSLQPNDGLIIDSLGWAYHKLGRNDDAVSEMESAVEQAAGDPIVNDHLGDVYWSVGRKREAYFQWAHARDSKPDPADLPRILAKLQYGLDGADKAATNAGTGNAAGSTATTTATAASTAPAATSITVGPGESLSSIAKRVFGSSDQYYRLYKANRGSIANPDMIYPGMQLTLPAPGAGQ